jgi:hypothetical protein
MPPFIPERATSFIFVVFFHLSVVRKSHQACQRVKKKDEKGKSCRNKRHWSKYNQHTPPNSQSVSYSRRIKDMAVILRCIVVLKAMGWSSNEIKYFPWEVFGIQINEKYVCQGYNKRAGQRARAILDNQVAHSYPLNIWQ